MENLHYNVTPPYGGKCISNISLATGRINTDYTSTRLFLPSHSFSSVFTEMKNPCTQVKQQACIFFHPSLVRIPAGRSHLATSHHQTHASQVREITMAQKLGQLHTSGDRLCYGTCTQQLLEMCALPIPPTWYQPCMSKIPR